MALKVDGWSIDATQVAAVGPVTTDVNDWISVDGKTIYTVNTYFAIQLAGDRILIERSQENLALDTVDLVKTKFKDELEALRTTVLTEMDQWWM